MRTKSVRKAYNEAKINEKWPKTQWAQKIAKRALVSCFRVYEA